MASLLSLPNRCARFLGRLLLCGCSTAGGVAFLSLLAGTAAVRCPVPGRTESPAIISTQPGCSLARRGSPRPTHGYALSHKSHAGRWPAVCGRASCLWLSLRHRSDLSRAMAGKGEWHRSHFCVCL